MTYSHIVLNARPLAILLLAFIFLSSALADNNFLETRKLAEQGNAQAQFELGRMFLTGELNEDKAKAYHQAVGKKNPSTDLYLGEMYLKGIGIPKNYVEALKWWTLAKAQGHVKAGELIVLLQNRMTPEQLAEAEILAQEFVSKSTE
ncbi:tetratricopeptide repeat protein [Pseudomonadota bacterium]